jgi:hypothetical protein
VGRGSACIFWNLHPLTGSRQLTALVSGDSAYRGEAASDSDLRDMAMGVLKILFGDIPEPIGVSVTRWLSDEYCKGITLSANLLTIILRVAVLKVLFWRLPPLPPKDRF